ncbi:Cytochrome P450 [Aspergillus sp. HF37]|nr:Cytochrome P450 [Aspergillus sp. HF37]
MLREVSVTRELNVWLVKQVDKLQAPLCQVFITPFSRPWLLLADSIEAQDIMLRRRWAESTGRLPRADENRASLENDTSVLQDLMGPSFLGNIVSPVMYENSVRLVKFWETKARLANGRPFDASEDLNHSALDGMLSFVFDRHFEHTALGPQAQALSHLDSSNVEAGRNGEAKFPEAPLNEFIAALYET